MYKRNTQKSVVFVYPNNEQFGMEVKKAISFTIASTGIIYFGINSGNKVKGVYTKNYKPSLKT